MAKVRFSLNGMEYANTATTAAAREKLAEELLFGNLLREAKRDASGQMDLRTWFGPASASAPVSVRGK